MKKTKDNLQKSDLREAARILDQIKAEANLRQRIEQISKQLIGRPYRVNPLGGGPEEKESFVWSIDGFDCVTYIETVLALAVSQTAEDALYSLRKIRYANGKVSWFTRNHYMVSWIHENEARGYVVDITKGAEAIEKTRLLNVVVGLPAKMATFSYYPKQRYKFLADKIETGDIILFASAKKHLDVFHTGFLIRRDDEIFLRHATRKRGAVVEQKLKEFLADHRMSGLILVRPNEKKSKRKR